MSDACYCDYEPSEFYDTREQVARKTHKCYECARAIAPGERYEYTVSKYDGSIDVSKTCPRCLALRKWVQAHVPCFCWYHGSMLDDADETMRQYVHEVPGLGMEYGRLRVAVNLAPRVSA